MYDIKVVNKGSVRFMNENYYKYVTVPMDDMWEVGIIAKGTYHLIGGDVGYFVLNEDKDLLQFHVEYKYIKQSDQIFQAILKQFKIGKAFVATYEPLYLNLCLDHNIRVKTKAYLYIENENVIINKPFDDIESDLAQTDDLRELLGYYKEKIGDTSQGLLAYLDALISNQSLLLYKIKDEIIGTGEIRPSLTNKAFANIGMTVSKDHRKNHIGAYILSQVRRVANSNGLQTICGTDVLNIASQKTIVKCGFYPYHRVLEIDFV